MRYTIRRLFVPVVWVGAVIQPAGASAVQNAPPTVAVSVRVDADLFLNNLDHSELVSFASATSDSLAALVGLYFPFLQWVASPTDEEEVAALTITVAAIDHPRGEEIVLAAEGRVGGVVFDLLSFPRPTLYEHFETPPTHDWEWFAADVLDLLDATFRDVETRRRLHAELLRRIPLVNMVFVNETLQRLILPLRVVDLRARDASVLRVSVANLDTGVKDYGWIRMNPDGSATLGGKAGFLRCAVTEFSLPPERLVTPWHPKIGEVLASDRFAVTVSMEEYVLDNAPPNSDGGVIRVLDENND